MRYKLIKNSLNDIYNPKETILLNRGIEDIEKYTNLDDSVLCHFSLLNNIDVAVKSLLEHIENKNKIHIIVDSDCDGYTSASILYKYLKLLDNDIDITYSIHTGKQHGISDDISIPEDVKLLIVPDAGTNDREQCIKLKKNGIDIIILDHHIPNNVVYDDEAILVNNQCCEYPNKSLSGVGIVYKFLQAVDEETWSGYADCFLDLVALGNVADVMDIRSFETRRLIEKGLLNIRNKFFKALIEKQSYSIGNEINIINVQWFIVPLINGLIRAGNYDEKEMMFKAFIETDETFKYKPRRKSKDDPEPEEIDETIYDRVARFCANARQRQNKSKDKGIIDICEYIEEKQHDKNKIIIANVTDRLDENLTGVTAIKIAEKYNKPCLLLRKMKDDENYYGGSGRNIDNSPIDSLRDFLNEIGTFEYVSGHDNAFGVSINKNNIQNTINIINEKLNNVDFSPCYSADFIFDINYLDIRFIKELDNLKDYYGQGIKEAYIVIKNVEISKKDINLIGKNSDTMKFIYNDEITFIKFKCSSENDQILQWLSDWDNEEESMVINLVGKCKINNYNSILTPQVIIEDYERIR